MKKKVNISELDKKDWEEFTKNPKDIFDKDREFSKKQNSKSRFKFDLHGFTLEEANSKIHNLIKYCIDKKYEDILLITGKGIHSKSDSNVFVSNDQSKLRYSVPNYIQSNNELQKLIVSIGPAKIEEGGDGAVVIKLKKL